MNADLRPGDTLGKYVVREPLGHGGMAAVYRAEQPTLQRMVALKVIRASSSGDPEFQERFQREARASARLDHPNIVQVYDFDQIEGRAFLAMQLLEGGTLRDRALAAQGAAPRLPRQEVARIIGEVAAGLGYAHRLGIVHRDIKPSNIMFTRDGRAVVGDFGIARILSATQAGAQLTQTGVGIGTPEYMSPEQVQGGELDARSDEYALGIVAYELLTGRPPFVGDTPFTIVLKQVREALPPPRRFDPTIGAQTERVLMKVLAKDPKERYAGAEEFASALSAALAAEDVRPTTVRAVATPWGPLSRRSAAMLAAGALLALALGGTRVLGIFDGAATSLPGKTPATATVAGRLPETAAPSLAVAAKAPSVEPTRSPVPSSPPPAPPAPPAPATIPPATAPPVVTKAPTPVPTPAPTAVPEPTPAAPAPTPAFYRIGQTATLTWESFNVNKIEVTLRQVIDPATVDPDAFIDPDNRFVAFRITIKNLGPDVYDEYPENNAEAVDAQGRQYQARADEPVEPGFGNLRIGPGVAIDGHITVEMPKGALVRGFLFSAAAFEATARWNLD
ncbi:MAG: serine/threonine-protein kinase [Chloroflexota bacterium]